MATYDKLIYNIAPYQEGNEADLEFELDSNFPIANVGNVTFQARNTAGRLIMPEKDVASGEITLTGRVVYIPFTAAEMRNIAGVHKYEIDFINLQGKPFATIGGSFTVNAQINKR